MLRNINLSDGLCNGTRLKVKELLQYCICAEIITGNNSGNTVLLPRIDLNTPKDELPFEMKRRQFPIRLGYAMTINKSQGQTFNKVRVYLPAPVFSHGQLYVALSRVTTEKSLKIYIKNNASTNIDKIYTRNVVYNEILK